MNMNTTKIINELEKLYPKNVETQTDLIARMLSEVPVADHEAVMQECAIYCTLANSTRYMENMTWGDQVAREEDAKDARFVAMTPSDWKEVQQVAAGRRTTRPWFPSWDAWVVWVRRIDNKRNVKPCREIIRREPDQLTKLVAERRDTIRYPTSTGSQEDYENVISSYEEAIRALPGGAWRLELEYRAERPALQVRIDEIVAQVKVMQKVKKTLAAMRIQRAWRARETVCYPDLNKALLQPATEEMKMEISTYLTSFDWATHYNINVHAI